MRSTLLLLAALFLVLFACACNNPTKYKSARKTPFTPAVDSVFYTTRDDTIPCVRVLFSFDDTLPVTFTIYRSLPGSASFALLKRKIPQALRAYDDEQISDSMNPDAFANIYSYSMEAISAEDSASTMSNQKSLQVLGRPLQIDYVSLSTGIPEVAYSSLGTSLGISWTIQVVKRDSVIAQKSFGQTFGDVKDSYFFTELIVDTLKARMLADSTDNGTYGVRLLSLAGSSVGLAVKKFNVK